MDMYEIGLVITIPSFIFIFTCLKTLQFCGFSPFLYIFKYQSLNVVLYNTIIRLICLNHNSKVLSKSFPGKAIFPFTDLKRQQKAVFTAFAFPDQLCLLFCICNGIFRSAIFQYYNDCRQCKNHSYSRSYNRGMISRFQRICLTFLIV